ncbi:MAG TPA: mechanosensitive ion channel family protein [Verrucomicrobiota bacterium]|nr:mechanosensitive ion channel family protein [Verrucomicrobiota bacterium]
MKIKLNSFFNVYIGVLVAVLLFAVWADAQTTVTNLASTTNNAPAALSSSQAISTHSLTFGFDQIEIFRILILGYPIYQYIASLIYISIAYLGTLLIDFILNRIFKGLAKRTESKYDDLLIDLLRKPVKVIIFVIFLHIGLDIFNWPEWIELYISKGLKLVVAWSITIMAMRSIDVLLGFMEDKAAGPDKAFDAQLFGVLKKTLKIILAIIAILVTAQNLDINITSLLASLSIGGLALGLAAQETIANFIGAIAIFLDRPFHIGERIRWDSYDGFVERIGLRSTLVRNLDGHLISVPNKIVAQSTIVNISRRPAIKTSINIGIIYETPLDKIKLAIQTLDEIYRTHPKTKDVLVGLDKFNDSSINILVVHWWNGVDYKEYVAGMQELNLAILKRFNEEGIVIAYPTQVNYIKTV